jgi:solute carrier family 25 phosphate transporter 3
MTISLLVSKNVSKYSIFLQLISFYISTAQEDIQLSLVISLVGGMTGGLVAAIVSNPADATISEMKKTSAKVGPVDAVKGLIKRGGYANLMRGLPIRMAFYPLIVSMQFFVFDSIRLYLGIGSDDLKLYLDVLGGALKDGGSMVGPT